MLDLLNDCIISLNDFIWSYLLIASLLGLGLYFTWKTRFVQFRNLSHTLKLLGEGVSHSVDSKRSSVSSFQAFCITTASRVGTGNLAGVATALVIGGPGALFWMWLIALIGSASAFVESTLAQIFKQKHEGGFIGGPAYYMEKGLGKRWMGILFAVLITLTFGLIFNSVQSNTITLAFQNAFGTDRLTTGIAITVATLLVIFGGIHRIAKVSSVIVPLMALLYIGVALYVTCLHWERIPSIFGMIIAHAFGWEQVFGGGVSAALMQGIRRGLFSNEAGMGSAPNGAATADVSHPVKQGFIQMLGVFTDTLLICSSTAFIILVAEVPMNGSLKGIELTQAALDYHFEGWGKVFVAIAITLFAFSSIIGNYYYGEANIHFISKRKIWIRIYRAIVGLMVLWGAIAGLDLVWNMADLSMALMTFTNLIAIFLLGKLAFTALKEYQNMRNNG